MNTNTNQFPARKTLIAKNPETGKYFTGRAFDGDCSQALVMPETTTADDFKLAWACPVVMEYTASRTQEGQARAYVRNLGRMGRHGSTAVQLPIRHKGAVIMRKVHVPAKSNAPAWIRTANEGECALTMVNGELSTDF